MKRLKYVLDATFREGCIRNELVKIRDASTKYIVSARTLKYYEDMGLLTSTHKDTVAYSKAKEIETQIVNAEYIGKPANINRWTEITD